MICWANTIAGGTQRPQFPRSRKAISLQVYICILIRLEHLNSQGQPGHGDGNHCHELDQDIQAGAGSILEWIPDGVANDASLVGI